MRKSWKLLAFSFVLAGCTTLPDLNSSVSESAKQADFPRLVPAEFLLARKSDGRLSEQDGDILLARAANLRARGRILRGLSSIDDANRLRIQNRFRRLGG